MAVNFYLVVVVFLIFLSIHWQISYCAEGIWRIALPKIRSVIGGFLIGITLVATVSYWINLHYPCCGVDPKADLTALEGFFTKINQWFPFFLLPAWVPWALLIGLLLIPLVISSQSKQAQFLQNGQAIYEKSRKYTKLMSFLYAVSGTIAGCSFFIAAQDDHKGLIEAHIIQKDQMAQELSRQVMKLTLQEIFKESTNQIRQGMPTTVKDKLTDIEKLREQQNELLKRISKSSTKLEDTYAEDNNYRAEAASIVSQDKHHAFDDLRRASAENWIEAALIETEPKLKSEILEEQYSLEELQHLKDQVNKEVANAILNDLSSTVVGGILIHTDAQLTENIANKITQIILKEHVKALITKVFKGFTNNTNPSGASELRQNIREEIQAVMRQHTQDISAAIQPPKSVVTALKETHTRMRETNNKLFIIVNESDNQLNEEVNKAREITPSLRDIRNDAVERYANLADYYYKQYIQSSIPTVGWDGNANLETSIDILNFAKFVLDNRPTYQQYKMIKKVDASLENNGLDPRRVFAHIYDYMPPSIRRQFYEPRRFVANAPDSEKTGTREDRLRDSISNMRRHALEAINRATPGLDPIRPRIKVK